MGKDVTVKPETITIDELLSPKPKGKPKTFVGAEVARLVISGALLFIFAAVIIVAMLSVDSENWSNIKELLEIVIPVLTTLIGSSIGFYFGKSSSN